MKKHYILLIALFTTVLFTFGQNTGKDGKMTFQGSLFQNGEPFSGNVELTFTVPLASGDWTETISGVSVANGLYSVVLGNTNPIPNDLFMDASSRQVSVSVDGTGLGQVTIYPSFVPGIIQVDSVFSNTLYIDNEETNNYTEVNNFAYRIRNRNEAASSVYLTNNNSSRLQLADFDETGATRSLAFLTARSSGNIGLTMDRFETDGSRNLLAEMYSSDLFIDGTVLRDGYARGGVDFYNNRGQQTSWFTSMPGDEGGGDPDGWSAGMGMYGTNSINFVMEGKKWENNNLGAFSMFGEHTNGDGWFNRNIAMNVNSDGTKNSGQMEFFNTVEGAGGEERVININSDTRRITLFDPSGEEAVNFDGNDGSAFFQGGVQFNGDVVINGTLTGPGVGGGAPSVPDGGSFGLNNSNGGQSINLNGEAGSGEFAGSLNANSIASNSFGLGNGRAAISSADNGNGEFGTFDLRSTVGDGTNRISMGYADANEVAGFISLWNEDNELALLNTVLDGGGNYGALALGGPGSVSITGQGDANFSGNVTSSGSFTQFLNVQNENDVPNFIAGTRDFDPNNSSDLGYMAVIGNVFDPNISAYPFAAGINSYNDGTEQYAEFFQDITASDASYNRPMSKIGYDASTGTGFFELYDTQDGSSENNVRMGVDGGGLGYLELKGRSGEFFRMDANGIDGSSIAGSSVGLGNGRASISSADNGNGEYGTFDLRSTVGDGTNRISMGYADANEVAGFISLWNEDNELALLNTVLDGGGNYGALALGGPGSVSITGQGNIDVSGSLSGTNVNVNDVITQQVNASTQVQAGDFFGGTGSILFASGDIDATGNISGVDASFSGDLVAATVNGTSDKRFKKNVTPIAGALSNTLKLNGYTYNWNATAKEVKGINDEGEQIGVVAQELEKVYPQLVKTDAKGYKSVNYAALSAVLLEAIKELNAEVSTLKDENAELKAEATKTAELSKRIETIEKLLELKAGSSTSSANN